MSRRSRALATHLSEILASMQSLRARCSSAAIARAMDRIESDGEAIRHHLARDPHAPIMLAILGGTGTGKSTLVNRLLGSNLTATSYKRTFTAGPVAICPAGGAIPASWLGVPHEVLSAADLPARGRADVLSIVKSDRALPSSLIFIDTPDLDGDQPAHHAQADRVFRWADAVLMLVTPEKYQMTELLPYYRLAARYEIPRLFAMNKVEEQAVVEDYRRQVAADVFVVQRDDSAFQPPAEAGLAALQKAIASIHLPDVEVRQRGIATRASDLVDRLRDQVLEPLRQQRREADQLIASMRAMQTPPPGVDVDPLMQALQRRLQERSVLYLMGPARMLDRVRQIPGILARLPRTTWDLLRSGRISRNGSEAPPDLAQGLPDFRAALSDQLAVVQTRLEDAIRSAASGESWVAAHPAEFASTRIDPAEAARIADEEIAALKEWLENHWNATPRDTAVLMKLLKFLPGADKLTQWSEAAPYILAVVVAAHHAFFGPIDLLVIGGFSLATWLTEKISNQVAARARVANNAIARRFTALAHQQIDRSVRWVDSQAPPAAALDHLQQLADCVSEAADAPDEAPARL